MRLRISPLILPLLIIFLVLAIAVLPFASRAPSYSALNGEMFSLAQVDPSGADTADSLNLNNPQVSSNSTSYNMSIGPPPDPTHQSIYTKVFLLTMPYQRDLRFSFAGSIPNLDYAKEAVRISIRMVNRTNVIQQFYIIGRPQEKLTIVNSYLYYSIALPNSTSFSFTRNVTSDLESEGVAPSTNWTMVWIGIGIIRYPTVANSLLTLSMDRISTLIHSDIINPVRFSFNYNSQIFLPLVLVGIAGSTGFLAAVWSELKPTRREKK